MRKFIPFVVAAVLSLSVSLASAQPTPGFSKTAPLAGSGTVASPLRITPCSLNEILKWNGSLWACASDSGGVTDGDKGDITVTSSGATWTVDPNAIDFAKQADIATARIVGRVTGGTGDPEALTGTQATTLLDSFTSGLKGLAPASGGGTTNFLRADGNWSAPVGAGDITDVVAGNGMTGGGSSGSVTLDVACLTGLTCNANSIQIADGDRGDITPSSSGSVWTIDNDVVTYAKMQNVSATNRFLGRITAGAGDTEELTGTQATSLLDTFSTAATTKGVVPGSNGGGATVYLNGAGAWTVPTGSVSGTGTNNTLAKWTGATTLGNSIVTESGTALSVGGSVTTSNFVASGAYVQANGGVYGGSSTNIALITLSGGTVGAIYSGYSVAGDSELQIQPVGQTEGTAQFRDVGIYNGKGTRYVLFDGNTSGVAFDGDVTLGNADADTNMARGRFGFSGTDVSVSSGNCTVAGEAQSFDLTTSGGDMTSCVVNYNRTFSVPRCTFSPKTSGAAASIASPGLYYTTSTTQFTLQHVSGNTPVGNTWSVHCFDDLD